jgi:hypothetical protein
LQLVETSWQYQFKTMKTLQLMSEKRMEALQQKLGEKQKEIMSL